MSTARAYLVVLVWSLACSGSSSPETPVGASAPSAKVDAKAEAKAVPPERPGTVASSGRAEPAPAGEGRGSGGEQPAEAKDEVVPAGSTGKGGSSGGEAKIGDADPPVPEPAAAPVPASEILEFDGVRWAPQVALSKPRAAAGNGRGFGIRDIFWASGGSTLDLDVIHFRKGEFAPLVEATFVAAEAAGTGDPEDIEPWLPSHPALKTVRTGETLSIVSTGGLASATVGAFAAEAGASDGHLYVRLKPPITSAKKALALRGAVDSGARLREPEAAAKPNAAIEAQRARARALASPEAKGRRLESSVASIRAAVAGSQLLTVKIPRKDEDDDYQGLSGIVVVEPSGTTHPLVEPAERSHQMDVLYLVDLDGDGLDEVVFRSNYFESSGYVYLAVWDGTRYINLKLSGDGG